VSFRVSGHESNPEAPLASLAVFLTTP